MPFISPDTMKALEGKYVKFQPGVKRTLKLVKHTYQEPDEAAGRKYDNHLIEVIDIDTGKEKEFNADFRFMNAMNKINHDLELGDVVEVNPTAGVYTNKMGVTKDILEYEIVKLEAAA
jgi:hypothetical protein